jgi:beta-N-acetylhexosaminidase
MGAIRKAYGYSDALRLALLAGIDVLTIANEQVYEPGIVGRTIDIIEGLVAGGQVPEQRIDESYLRIMTFKAGLASSG